MFCKHGCQEDPNIYCEWYHDRGAHGKIPIGSIHQKENYPFGMEYGLMTNLGIIAADNGNHMEDPYSNIIHGHVWSRELRGWVLFARYPKDNVNHNPRKIQEGGKNSKKPKQKEVESRWYPYQAIYRLAQYRLSHIHVYYLTYHYQ